MKKIIVFVVLLVAAVQIMVACGFVRPLFSFSYSYASDLAIITMSLIAVVFFYMIPTIVAMSRGHRNSISIAVVNIFFGWTLVGFVGCLAWALINYGDKK